MIDLTSNVTFLHPFLISKILFSLSSTFNVFLAFLSDFKMLFFHSSQISKSYYRIRSRFQNFILKSILDFIFYLVFHPGFKILFLHLFQISKFYSCNPFLFQFSITLLPDFNILFSYFLISKSNSRTLQISIFSRTASRFQNLILAPLPDFKFSPALLPDFQMLFPHLPPPPDFKGLFLYTSV